MIGRNKKLRLVEEIPDPIWQALTADEQKFCVDLQEFINGTMTHATFQRRREEREAAAGFIIEGIPI